jgi:pimeloyl-ACP methyl ester carboxylesterase
MPVFEHRGRRISYLDTAAAASAPIQSRALLLLHAFPLQARMWEPQLAAAPAGWRLVAPDFRGFGQSEPDASGFDVFMGDYADDAAALLDALGIGRAVVAGLSMGGYVAFGLLAQAPGRVAGLVLADTKPEGDTAEARAGRQQMIALLRERGVPGIVDQMVPRLLSDATRRERPDIERRVRELGSANSADGVGAALVRMMDRPDATSLLPTIACPTLVIVGEQDTTTPPAQARALQQEIRAAELVEIRGAGHLSNLEQPDAFNAALFSFLGEIGS